MQLGDPSNGDGVFLLSTTHGAENGCLAAFLATLDFQFQEPVIDYIWDYGNRLIKMMNDTARDIGISQGFKGMGLGCLPYFATLNAEGRRDQSLNTLFQQSMIDNGVIMRYISVAYRHSEEDMVTTQRALQKSLIIYKKAFEEGADKYINT